MPSYVSNLPIVRRSSRFGISCLAIAIVAISPLSAQTQQYSEKILYDFNNFLSSPRVTFDSQGNLYGAELEGTVPGAIFEMSPPGNGSLWWTQKILYSFEGGPDGGEPDTTLILDAQGNLYGVTASGGNNESCGVVFKLTPPSSGNGAWTESVLHDFAREVDGCNSDAFASRLVLDSRGNLYGVIQSGGASNDGVVYELSPPSSGNGQWTETILYTFTGGSDGLYPTFSVVMDSLGNFYGTTSYGGSMPGCGGQGCGVIFELSPPRGGGPWTETTLYTFTGGSDGGQSTTPILDSKGNLYGSTAAGGNTSACTSHDGTVPGCGGVFELSPPPGGAGAWTLVALYNFSGSDGMGPSPGLTFDSTGALIGVAPEGGFGYHNGSGIPCGLLGCGLIFSLTPPPGGTGIWTETALHYFSGSDGQNPFSTVLLDSQGSIYGILEIPGCIYEFSPTLLLPTSITFATNAENPDNLGQLVTFTATVTPSGPPTPTGTVAFASNGVAIEGCSSVTLSSGQAACGTTGLALGSDAVVAIYSGDATYSESAVGQAISVVEPQLGLAVSGSSVVSVNAGASASLSLNLTVIQGTPSGATTFACTGLPTGGTCSFSPSQATSYPASTALTISTTTTRSLSLRSRPPFLSFTLALGLPVLLLLPMKLTSIKRSWDWNIAVLLLLVLFTVGCGSSGTPGSVTRGSQNYTVVVTASASGAASSSATIYLTVVN